MYRESLTTWSDVDSEYDDKIIENSSFDASMDVYVFLQEACHRENIGTDIFHSTSEFCEP